MGHTMASGHVVAGSGTGGGADAGGGAADGVVWRGPEGLENGELLLQVFQQTLTKEQREAYDRLVCHTRCTHLYMATLYSFILPRTSVLPCFPASVCYMYWP